MPGERCPLVDWWSIFHRFLVSSVVSLVCSSVIWCHTSRLFMLLSQFVQEECVDEPGSENEQASDNPAPDPSTSAYDADIVNRQASPPGGKARTRSSRLTKPTLRLPSSWRRCSSGRRRRCQLYYILSQESDHREQNPFQLNTISSSKTPS